MKKYLALSIAFLMSGCASPPQPPLLSPYGRKPINTDSSIAEYREQTDQESLLRHERNELKLERDALKTKVDELRAYILLRETESKASTSGSKAHEPAVKLKAAAAKQGTALAPNSIEIVNGIVVFRVFNEFGATVFEPTDRIEKPLLDAAIESTHIDIRGRTDSDYPNQANQQVALGRAIAARDFLISHGVDSQKIRLYFSSSGMFIADNSTSEGRSFNRRVEVEARGVDVAKFQKQLTSI